MSIVETYLESCRKICDSVDTNAIDQVIELLRRVRERGGRLFFIGVGGGAGNASHAVNDFRKIAGIESYAPTDNVSELTARINDEGWESSYAAWLNVSRLNKQDCLFIFSVGGGNPEHGLSLNIVEALKYAKGVSASITGIVGRDGGETAKVADACITVPTIVPNLTTALTESFQAVLWHLMISDERLALHDMRWESSESTN